METDIRFHRFSTSKKHKKCLTRLKTVRLFGTGAATSREGERSWRGVRWRERRSLTKSWTKKYQYLELKTYNLTNDTWQSPTLICRGSPRNPLNLTSKCKDKPKSTKTISKTWTLPLCWSKTKTCRGHPRTQLQKQPFPVKCTPPSPVPKTTTGLTPTMTACCCRKRTSWRGQRKKQPRKSRR